MVTKVVGWDGALRTGSILATCTEELFWIVADKASKERVTTVDITITEAHLNAVDSSSFERLGNLMHTGMVEV